MQATNRKNTLLIVKKQKGFLFIEAMVALIILAIGLLGVAGMQAMSMKNNNSAIMRTHAIILAYDIIDRIRTNEETDYEIGIGEDPPSQNCLEGNNCTPTQLANFDLANWKCSLGSFTEASICNTLGVTGVLAQGDGSIALINDTYTVTIQWVDGDTGETKTFAMSAQI